MADKIVSLHGGDVAGYEPVANVVDLLKRFLDRAERGEIVSAAIATVRSDGAVGSAWEYANGQRMTTAAAVMMLHQRIAEDLTVEE